MAKQDTPKCYIGSQWITEPGICVSVDQMESPIPGLLAHIKGIPPHADTLLPP